MQHEVRRPSNKAPDVIQCAFKHTHTHYPDAFVKEQRVRGLFFVLENVVVKFGLMKK